MKKLEKLSLKKNHANHTGLVQGAGGADGGAGGAGESCAGGGGHLRRASVASVALEEARL